MIQWHKWSLHLPEGEMKSISHIKSSRACSRWLSGDTQATNGYIVVWTDWNSPDFFHNPSIFIRIFTLLITFNKKLSTENILLNKHCDEQRFSSFCLKSIHWYESCTLPWQDVDSGKRAWGGSRSHLLACALISYDTGRAVQGHLWKYLCSSPRLHLSIKYERGVAYYVWSG